MRYIALSPFSWLIKPPLFTTTCVALAASLAGASLSAATPETKPLKVLFVTGGGYHDYQKLAPYLTNELSQRINATFEIQFGLERLRDGGFAKGYDAVLFDHCDDEAPPEVLDNALKTIHNGMPAVMIHCAVHAFRKSPKIHEWETCCGMRSKVHDPYEPFEVTRLDPESPITKAFPSSWRTSGDELYQTISIQPESHQLLKAKSPKDGREHIVCWTFEYGKGRVFATTLGHDMKTTATPEYLQLVSNGILWACGKLRGDGHAAAGYGGPAKP
jgi:type 1 glutamine amidotransferase